MTLSPNPLAPPASPSRIPAPVCLLYTMLRHGRGLSHEEASRRIDSALDEVLDQIPAQAC